QQARAGNMTDRIGALAALVHGGAPDARTALASFYQEFEHEPLVIDKWFALQATTPGMQVEQIRALMRHPAFSLRNPNRARSLIFSFCHGNLAGFHAADGSGYAFWAEQVIALNGTNPQLAARLARTLDRWRKFTPALQTRMHSALRRVAASKQL